MEIIKRDHFLPHVIQVNNWLNLLLLVIKIFNVKLEIINIDIKCLFDYYECFLLLWELNLTPLIVKGIWNMYNLLYILIINSNINSMTRV